MPLTDPLKLIVVLRYSQEDKTGAFDRSYFTPLPNAAFRLLGVQPGPEYSDKREDEAVSGTFGFQYQFTSDVMGYLTYSRGFKAGGVNIDNTAAGTRLNNPEEIPGAVPLDPTYKPEFIDGYELGMKTQYADGRGRTNFAIFYDEMKDLQVAQFLGTQFTIVNAPEATVYGAEIENLWSFNDAWSLGLDATFFIATGYLDGGRMWNDRVIEAVRGSEGDALDLSSLGLGVHATTTPAQRRAAIDALIGQVRYREQAERDELASAIAAIARCDAPTDLMMTSDDIRTLAAAGMGIGAHTHRHPILSRLGVDAAEREIVESREVLEQLIGEAVPLFAYPNGRPGIDYGAEHVSIVERCGFDGAFSTSWGVADRSSDAFQLPRFLPWDRGRYAFAARLARNMTLAEPRAA